MSAARNYIIYSYFVQIKMTNNNPSVFHSPFKPGLPTTFFSKPTTFPFNKVVGKFSKIPDFFGSAPSKLKT